MARWVETEGGAGLHLRSGPTGDHLCEPLGNEQCVVIEAVRGDIGTELIWDGEIVSAEQLGVHDIFVEL